MKKTRDEMEEAIVRQRFLFLSTQRFLAILIFLGMIAWYFYSGGN